MCLCICVWSVCLPERGVRWAVVVPSAQGFRSQAEAGLCCEMGSHRVWNGFPAQ